MARRHRRAPDEGGSGYSWMDTYGDMVTLLLCFFVLLYSFSSIDAKKQSALINAFTGSESPSAINTMDAESVRKNPIEPIDSMVNYSNRTTSKGDKLKNVQSFDQLYKKIKKYISDNKLESQLTVYKTDDTIILRFGEVFLFKSGKADLLPSGQAQLKNIISVISQNSSAIKLITIEGNTDNVPIKNSKFSDNWDLSVTRACNVLHTVLNYGIIDPSKLAAVGYGEYQPIDTNLTAEGRARNRRVDFVIKRMLDKSETGSESADTK